MSLFKTILSRVLPLYLLLPLSLSAEITAGEYFVDGNDLGPGNNTAFMSVIPDGNNASLSESITVSYAGLSAGLHTISVRFEDDALGWGPPRSAPFLKLDEALPTEITSAEYFVDTDQGAGNNNVLPVDFNNGIASLNSEAGVAVLTPGIHMVYVRFYHEDNGWGPARGFPILKLEETLPTEITSAEYFVDTDQGAGNNNVLPVDFSSGIAILSSEVTEADLTPGVHVVYVRFFHEDAGWGPTRGFPILKAPASTADEIDQAEFYIDNDQGPGSNNSVTVTAGQVVDLDVLDHDVSELTPGIHTLGVRFHGQDYGWGPVKTRDFYKPDSGIGVNTITAAEYFIDSDNGPGNNTALEIETAGATVVLADSAVLTNEEPGLHALNIRFYGEARGWGPPVSRMFMVVESGDAQFITAAQYYIGDPGNPITIENAADGNFNEAQEAVNLVDVEMQSIGTGIVPVGVRFQSSSGQWGPWRTTPVFIPAEQDTLTIMAAEYFFDTDPGEGAGTSIAEPADGTYDEPNEEINLPVSVEGLELGLHYAFVRMQRSDGFWGPSIAAPFLVTEDAQPFIAGAEYYTDPTTQPGHGTAFNPLDGAFNSLEEEVALTVPVSELASFPEDQDVDTTLTVFVRFMNSLGEWGDNASRSVHVETRPQIDLSVDELDFGSLFTGDSRQLTFTIDNIGDEDLVVTNVSSDDPAFTVDWTNGTITPAGTPVTVTVTFAPEDPPAEHNATLTITNNDATATIAMNGAGLETAPIMTVTPDTLEFGIVSTSGSGKMLTTEVGNVGNEVLEVDISSSYATNNAFTANMANTSLDTTGNTVELMVTFAPITAGEYQDTVFIVSNDVYNSPYPIYVTGTASDVPVSDILLNVSSLNFGNIELDEAPTTLDFTVRNLGDSTLHVSDLHIDHAGPYTAFYEDADATFEIDPGAPPVTVTVTFYPTQNRVYEGSLIIACDDPDSPSITIPLHGSSIFPEMVLSTRTFEFGEVGVTESPTMSLTISNIGTDTLKIVDFVASAEIDSPVVTITPASYLILPPPNPSSKVFEVQFSPEEPIEYQGFVVIWSNDDLDTLVITGTGLDDAPPTITFNVDSLQNANIEAGNAIPFTFMISDNNQVFEASFNYRKGGNRSYTEVPLTPTPDGIYSTTIPANAVGDRGLEYYFEASDGANVQRVPPTAPDVPAVIQITLPTLDPISITPDLAEKYRMFSVPSDLLDKDVSTILEDSDQLGAYDIKKWRLFRWVNGAYVELNQTTTFRFNPGEAYWLITKDPEVIEFDISTTVPTDGSYFIGLDRGWNQVATPFSFPISVSDVIAANPGIIQGQVAYEWDQLEEDWVPIDTAGSFEPFDGYFIYAPSGGNDLVFPTREAQATVARRPLAQPFNLETREWVVQMSARTRAKQDRYNYAGVLKSAADELDISDRLDPPRPSSDGINLYFPHPEWDLASSRYAADFRQADGGGGQVWDLVLEKNRLDEDVTIDLQLMNDLPDDYEILVVNQGLRYVLGRTSEDRLRVVQEHFDGLNNMQLRLLVGNPQFIAEHSDGIGVAPEDFHLQQNYPNPFNGGTRIQYAVPEPAAVNLMIYDIVGRQVRELVSSAVHPVGEYALRWDGTNDQGQRVASGVYLIVFQSDDVLMTRKMVLLK